MLLHTTADSLPPPMLNIQTDEGQFDDFWTINSRSFVILKLFERYVLNIISKL